MSAAKGRRVLFVTGAYAPEFSAGGLQCQAIARQLSDRARVSVLTTATRRELPAFDRIDGVPVTRVHVASGGGRSGFGAMAAMTWALARLLRHVDLVHIQGISSKNVLIVAMARLFARPVILHLQTARHDEPAAIRARGWADWRAYLAARLYIAVSAGLKRSYLDAGLASEKIEVIPNGVDAARFRPPTVDERRALRHQLGLPADRPVLLFVGVMAPDKQPHVLLESWFRLQEQGLDATLVFVGASDPKLFELGDRLSDQLRNRLSSTALQERVRFVPPTPRIEDYYRAADVLVMPSAREGLPNVVLEAMACGLPVVASRLPGSTDTIIDDRNNGRLVAPGDVDGFAAAIADVLRDAGAAERLGAAARRTVEERFQIGAVAEQWLRAYDRVLLGSAVNSR